MRIGGFNASAIPYFTAVSIASAIVICEILAVRYGQEKPFPQATISSTADHYPSYLVFRIATQCGATLLIISWLLNYFMLRTRCPKVELYFPQLTVLLGTAGAICLMGSTATLDTGKHNTNWHVICATSFFLLSIVACLHNTLICYLAQRKSQCFSRNSMIVKYLLSLLLAVWLYLALYAKSPNKNFGNIVEYTLAFLILGYICLMGYDMRNFKLDYQLQS